MSDLNKVRAYLRDREGSYIEFLDEMKDTCKRIADKVGSQVILRVYDRRDKQGGAALKDAAKVFDACKPPISASSIKDVADIIGLTIVVQYPDQIKLVLDRPKEEMEGRSATEIRRKGHMETYFATHAIYRSDLPVHGRILCEVQCKTVLHDAWSAKMHDLTYKPSGSMDSRMKGLIEAISQSLEGLEQQSQIARDMILSRQRGERRPFLASLAAFLSDLEDTLLGAGQASVADLLEGLRNEVKEFTRETSLATRGAASKLNSRIQAALDDEQTAGTAWLIAVRFASSLGSGEALRFLNHTSEHLFDMLPGLRQAGRISEREVRAIPIGFYALQDFASAIESAERLISGSETFHLSPECVSILKFNKATWMLERESMRPSKQAAAASVRAEIESLLSEVGAYLKEADEPSLVDTEGLLKIVYGTTKQEIRDGIDLCLKAAELVQGNDLEKAVALAYVEWRNHLGWRRYFELAEKEIDPQQL